MSMIACLATACKHSAHCKHWPGAKWDDHKGVHGGGSRHGVACNWPWWWFLMNIHSVILARQLGKISKTLVSVINTGDTCPLTRVSRCFKYYTLSRPRPCAMATWDKDRGQGEVSSVLCPFIVAVEIPKREGGHFLSRCIQMYHGKFSPRNPTWGFWHSRPCQKHQRSEWQRGVSLRRMVRLPPHWSCGQ